MLLGKYDIIILAIALIANILFLTKFKELRYSSIIKILAYTSYLFLFPHLSAKIEVKSITENNEVIDGFNTFYLWFKYPIYWTLGLINWGIIYWFKSFSPNKLLNRKLKEAVYISKNVHSRPTINYNSSEDFYLTLKTLQEEIENKNLQVIDKLLAIFEINSDWENIVGNDFLRQEIYNILSELIQENKETTGYNKPQ